LPVADNLTAVIIHLTYRLSSCATEAGQPAHSVVAANRAEFSADTSFRALYADETLDVTRWESRAIVVSSGGKPPQTDSLATLVKSQPNPPIESKT
jgi:hypothetical protein